MFSSMYFHDIINLNAVTRISGDYDMDGWELSDYSEIWAQHASEVYIVGRYNNFDMVSSGFRAAHALVVKRLTPACYVHVLSTILPKRSPLMAPNIGNTPVETWSHLFVILLL